MFEEPTFLVQVGHHGKNRVENAIKNEHLDGAVLSPTDYKPGKNSALATKLSDKDLVTLFDPHFYLPGQGDREDLNKYDYHDDHGGDDFTRSVIFDPDTRESFSKKVIQEQNQFDVDAYISPSPHMDEISKDEVDDWEELSEGFIDTVKDMGENIPVFVSLPINGERLHDDEKRNYLLNAATRLDADGFYTSISYSDRDTRLPLKGEENLRTQLDLVGTLRANRYQVISAHTHQVAHLLFTMGVNAIASGHYKNLRNLDPERWVVPDDTQIRRTVVRYYSDDLLNSIRPDQLLNELYTETSFDEDTVRTKSPYEEDLFDGPLNPEETGWTKADGCWDHYTWACHQIAEEYQGKDLSERHQNATNKVLRAKAIYNQIDNKIDENVDELDPEVYNDWETVLGDIKDSTEFKRLKRRL